MTTHTPSELPAVNFHVPSVKLATPSAECACASLVVAKVGADERQVARREELCAQRLEAGTALAELLDVEPVQQAGRQAGRQGAQTSLGMRMQWPRTLKPRLA